MKYFFLVIAGICIQHTVSKAQNTWTLKECIDHAIEKNITIQQAKLSAELSQNTVTQSKMDLYTPYVQSDITYSYNFSNSVDPVTYDFIRENTQSSGLGIVGNYNLFEGLGRIFKIKAAQEEVSASGMNVQQMKQNTALLVATYYLQILLAKEVFVTANNQVLITKKQKENTQALVDAGIAAQGELLEVEAQLANEEMNQVNAKNALNKSLAELKLLLQLDPYEDFDIVKPAANQDISNDAHTIEASKEVMHAALQNIPSIQQSAFLLQAAQYRLKVAKSALSPTFAVNGYAGTNYFSRSREVIGIDGGGNILYRDIPGKEQLKNNLSQQVRFTLSVPIFSKGQRMIAIDNAKTGIRQAELNVAEAANSLQKEVFEAYIDMMNAKETYHATKASKIAAEEAYRYAEEKQKAGLINSYEFQLAKSRLGNAESTQIQAKYDYLFKKMVVDYYAGKTLAE